MFHRAVGLYLSIAAMVVGDEQSLCRDDLPGATATKVNDSIFKTGPVHAVNIFGCETETEFLHLRDLLLYEHGEPHAFIGKGRNCRHKQEMEDKNETGE